MEVIGLLQRHTEGEGNDGGDVGVPGDVDIDRDAERLAEKAHGLDTLLVVWTTAADVDLHPVADEGCLVLLKSTDDTLEGRGDVGEVGDTTTGARHATSREID